MLPAWVPLIVAFCAVLLTIASRVTSRRDRFCLAFDECGKHDAALVGGKGCNLGELVSAGFPVPPGFCITSAAYRVAAEHLGLSSRSPADALRTVTNEPLPVDVVAAIAQSYAVLSRAQGTEALCVAVRSSCTAEDSTAASFAGQLESFLGVVGQDQVLDAVRACWGSLYAERVQRYRQGMDSRDAVSV